MMLCSLYCITQLKIFLLLSRYCGEPQWKRRLSWCRLIRSTVVHWYTALGCKVNITISCAVNCLEIYLLRYHYWLQCFAVTADIYVTCVMMVLLCFGLLLAVCVCMFSLLHCYIFWFLFSFNQRSVISLFTHLQFSIISTSAWCGW